MKFRLVSTLCALALLAGCPFSRTDPNKKAKGKKPDKTKDVSSDVAFQSFVGRLAFAVQQRDIPVLEQMMSRGFGHRWEAVPAGETPFAYWDKNNLWPALGGLLRERWVPHEGFMVVPAEMAVNPNYDGWRAGVRMENGAWRFAYFVPAEPPEEVPASPAPTAL